MTHHVPAGVRAIAIVNAVSAILTAAFWALVYLRLFAGAPIVDPVAHASAGATLGYLVGDVVWALPLLVLSVPALLGGRPSGWLFAQMINVLWWYSMTAVWVRDLYTGVISPGAVLFAPFALFSFWAAVYLWRVREQFWRSPRSTADQSLSARH